MSSEKLRRRFDRVDAAVLVTATVLGALMAKKIFGLYTSTMFDDGRHNPHGFRLWRYVAVPLFASRTFALIPLHFRRPGPRLRVLARRPGFVTVLIVALLAFRALAEQAGWLIPHHRQFGIKLGMYGLIDACFAFPGRLVFISDPTGFAVAATWFALRFASWWRPEAGWIDRAGRAQGWYWIAMFVASSYERAAS